MCTVIDLALAGVPHHFGFCTSRMVEPETDAISKGPPERSMPGLTVGAGGVPAHLLHDVRRHEVGEERSASRRSVFLNFTVTVWPPLDPVTDAMSR